MFRTLAGLVVGGRSISLCRKRTLTTGRFQVWEADKAMSSLPSYGPAEMLAHSPMVDNPYQETIFPQNHGKNVGPSKPSL